MTWGKYREGCIALALLFADKLNHAGKAQYWEDQANAVDPKFYSANISVDAILDEFEKARREAEHLIAENSLKEFKASLGNSEPPWDKIRSTIPTWQGDDLCMLGWMLIEAKDLCPN